MVGRPVVKWMGWLMLMRHAREGGYVTDIYRAELKMWSKATIMFQESGENMQERNCRNLGTTFSPPCTNICIRLGSEISSHCGHTFLDRSLIGFSVAAGLVGAETSQTTRRTHGCVLHKLSLT